MDTRKLLEYLSTNKDNVEQEVVNYIKDNMQPPAQECNIEPATNTEPPKKLTIKYIEELMLKGLDIEANGDIIYNILNEYVERFNTEQKTDIKNHVSVRDSISCIRYTWFKTMRYAVRHENPRLDLAGLTGSLIHGYLQLIIPHLSSEKLFKINALPMPVWGKYDMLLNSNTLVEFKTSSSLPAKANKKHNQQLLVYSYIFREFFNYNITLAQLVYISRANFKIRIFNTTVTDEITQSIGGYLNSYLTELKKYVDLQVPPPLDNEFISINDCRYCPFKSDCAEHKT